MLAKRYQIASLYYSICRVAAVVFARFGYSWGSYASMLYFMIAREILLIPPFKGLALK